MTAKMKLQVIYILVKIYAVSLDFDLQKGKLGKLWKLDKS